MGERRPQVPAITAVLREGLDVRGAELQAGLLEDVQAIWDASNRHPELMSLLGLVPWSCRAVQAAVAGERSWCDVQANPGYIVVVTNVWSKLASAILVASWENLNPAGATTQPVLSRDMRLGVNGTRPEVLIRCQTDAGSPSTNAIWAAEQNDVPFPPLVLRPIQAANHLTIWNETVNSVLDVIIAGYAYARTGTTPA